MLSCFPRGVLNEILNLIESVSEGFPSYSDTNDFVLMVLSIWQNRNFIAGFASFLFFLVDRKLVEAP